jgi:hypothetical protein
MTIAGGMVCKDGVLVYADTEWTASTMKIQRGKHWALGGGSGEFKCVIAGAGDEDYLRLAIQTFWAELNTSGKKDLRTGDAIDALRNSINAVYTNQIYPDPKGAGKEFGMVVGISTPQDKPMLLKTVGTGILLSDSYEYVYLGAGMEMGMYLTSRLHVSGMPIATGELMAAFILWEVKQHIKTCGGDTVIYKLDDAGNMQYRAEGDIRDFQDHFSSIDRQVQRIRVHTANLESSNDEFEAKLAGFSDDLRALRKVRLEKLSGERNLKL